jgi:hypothetical protein
MGATSSKQPATGEKSLSHLVDYIATNYILTQNFRDMQQLADPKYCNELVILTADVISKNLKDEEITYLAQRMEEGVEINEMTKEKVIFLKKKSLDELDISNSTTKRRVCIGIAKFYVLVGHLFAAIVTTINPVYTYKDSQGATMKASLLEKQDIPKDAKTNIKKLNLCSQRLKALTNNQNFDVTQNVGVTVKPNFCEMNYKYDDAAKRYIDRNLANEPGIPELEKLYFDIYNNDTGGFTKMSSDMRKNVYTPDVERFYTAFTGNKSIPIGPDGTPVVKKFSDIPLRDFHRSKGCEKDGFYTQAYTGTLKEKRFADYAKHLRDMMQTTTDNQNKLIQILDQIFVIANNPKTQRKETVISPALTLAKLNDLIQKTRNIIVELYIKCEDDFIQGIKLFEAIVEGQIMDTSKAQIKGLEEIIQDSIANPPPAFPATAPGAVAPPGAPPGAPVAQAQAAPVAVAPVAVAQAPVAVAVAQAPGPLAPAPAPVAVAQAPVAVAQAPVAVAQAPVAAPAPVKVIQSGPVEELKNEE